MTTTIEFITALFYEVDEQLRALPKHPEAHLWPSEVVTLGLLHALKGGGNRAFYRWLTSSHSRRRPILLKINDLSHLAFVNIKSIESITYALHAASNGQVFN